MNDWILPDDELPDFDSDGDTVRDDIAVTARLSSGELRVDYGRFFDFQFDKNAKPKIVAWKYVDAYNPLEGGSGCVASHMTELRRLFAEDMEEIRVRLARDMKKAEEALERRIEAMRGN